MTDDSDALDALPVVAEATGLSPRTAEREAAIAYGVSLIQQGASTRSAEERCGIDQVTLWRRAKRCESASEDDPEAVRRIHAKAAVLTEQSLERMMRDLPDAEPKLLASWLTAGAKVAGVIGTSDPSGATSAAIDAMLDALKGGDTLTLAARIERK